MSLLLMLSRLIDTVSAYVGRIATWSIVVAILISTLNAMARRFFGVSSNAWLELQWYLFGAVVMLCAAWALKEGDHIRIDIISSRLSQRTANWLDLFGLVVFVLPFVLLMTWLSLPYAWGSFRSGETSVNPGGLSIWPVKAIILTGFGLLLLQTLSEIVKRAAVIAGIREEPHVEQGHSADSADK